MKTIDGIHDMIMAGDMANYRHVADILLAMLDHIDTHRAAINAAENAWRIQSARPQQPMQPLYYDDQDVLRFQPNAIVVALLEFASAGRKVDLNDLAIMQFSQADREHFAQLIGYSLSGFGELSYVSDATYERASARISDVKPRPLVDYTKPHKFDPDKTSGLKHATYLVCRCGFSELDPIHIKENRHEESSNTEESASGTEETGDRSA